MIRDSRGYLLRPGWRRAMIPTKTPACRIQLSGRLSSSLRTPLHVRRTKFSLVITYVLIWLGLALLDFCQWVPLEPAALTR
jgi:hypothetical protein